MCVRARALTLHRWNGGIDNCTWWRHCSVRKGVDMNHSFAARNQLRRPKTNGIQIKTPGASENCTELQIDLCGWHTSCGRALIKRNVLKCNEPNGNCACLHSVAARTKSGENRKKRPNWHGPDTETARTMCAECSEIMIFQLWMSNLLTSHHCYRMKALDDQRWIHSHTTSTQQQQQ